MDAELQQLQQELAAVQQADVVQRLSEANVVELVLKLRQLGKIDVREKLDNHGLGQELGPLQLTTDDWGLRDARHRWFSLRPARSSLRPPDCARRWRWRWQREAAARGSTSWQRSST